MGPAEGHGAARRAGWRPGALPSTNKRNFSFLPDFRAGGVSILTAEPPVEGTEVTLHVPYLGAFKAESVYVAADRVGLRFLIDEQTQGDLVKQLSALLHGDRRRPEAESPEPGEPESLPRTATG